MIQNVEWEKLTYAIPTHLLLLPFESVSRHATLLVITAYERQPLSGLGNLST